MSGVRNGHIRLHRKRCLKRHIEIFIGETCDVYKINKNVTTLKILHLAQELSFTVAFFKSRRHSWTAGGRLVGGRRLVGGGRGGGAEQKGKGLRDMDHSAGMAGAGRKGTTGSWEQTAKTFREDPALCCCGSCGRTGSSTPPPAWSVRRPEALAPSAAPETEQLEVRRPQ